MTGDGGASTHGGRDAAAGSRRLGDIFTGLRRVCWAVVVLGAGAVVVGLIKLDRARRELTPPSIGPHGDVVSLYEPAVFCLVAGSGAIVVAVLVLALSFKPLR